MPTFTIRRKDVEAPWPVALGLSGRVQQWQADSEGGNGILTTDRRIIKRDVVNCRALVSAVVTVLDEEDDLLTVRDATDAEAARVIAAERTWR
ncbi:hypothetical protein [Microtetraspora malaysiensis]|uniref:hypothetical protein n=1 Tax=Microtetraspora malaysiensis TaxID=161358 RepID=UPI003D927DA0